MTFIEGRTLEALIRERNASPFPLDGVMEYFLQDDLGFTALHLAVKHGHLEMVELLLAEGANTHISDSRGWTALHFAVESRDADVISLLISHGADGRLEDHSGKARLQWQRRVGRQNS